MTNKKEFQEPTMEIEVFDTEDIITASGGFEGEWDNLEVTLK